MIPQNYRLAALIFFIIFAIPTLFGLFFTTKYTIEITKSRNWKEGTATIERLELINVNLGKNKFKKKVFLEYKYRINQHDFKSSSICVNCEKLNEADQIEIYEKLINAKQIRIYVNPENPHQTIVVIGFTKIFYYLLFACIIALSFTSLFFFLMMSNVPQQRFKLKTTTLLVILGLLGIIATYFSTNDIPDRISVLSTKKLTPAINY